MTVCPELCAGVFVRKFGDSNDATETQRPENGLHKVTSSKATERLIGCIIATKTHAESITDASMEIPELDEYYRVVSPESDTRGHRDDGPTIAVHIVVVDPEFQGQSIGSLMLKDYIQRMTSLHVGERISIIVHDRLVPFYQKLGFVRQGPSECTFSGGGWINMSRPISENPDDDED